MRATNCQLAAGIIFLLAGLSVGACNVSEAEIIADVVVIGGGTGGVAAGIAAARADVKTLIVEETPWLGGMLTSAGVSATDGNHWMPAGIWGEFRQRVWDHYGGADSVATGWVSLTHFEPHVGANIFAKMASEESNLTIKFNTKLNSLRKLERGWELRIEDVDSSYLIRAIILIDATDLGDVAAAAGCTYDLGMDSRISSGESNAMDEGNDIIQDMIYTAILKDYASGDTHILDEPLGYDPGPFWCACQTTCHDSSVQTHPCTTMLTYAKLPREKYLINWPIHGNDFYANMVEMNSTDRAEVYQQAKNRTLAFIYFIQHELGFKNLGLADDEYDTRDLLPFIPYHREGRRIHGISRFTCDHILDPYATTLYRTGIAVGDYPIDHHHGKNPNAPAIIFPSIPAFSIPLGALIPKSVEDLLIADKAISVSNIANGSTRLQPVMLQVGQAAGTTAALAVKENKRPREVSLRAVQRKVLNQGGYIVPSYDVLPDDPHFRSMQMAGATGLIRGLGEPHAWANRTWYYPDSTMSRMELSMNLSQYVQLVWQNGDQEPLTTLDFLHSAFTGLAARFTFAVRTCSESEWSDLGLKNYNVHRPLTRREISVAVEHMIPLFDLEVNHEGKLVSTVF